MVIGINGFVAICFHSIIQSGPPTRYWPVWLLRHWPQALFSDSAGASFRTILPRGSCGVASLSAMMAQAISTLGAFLPIAALSENQSLAAMKVSVTIPYLSIRLPVRLQQFSWCVRLLLRLTLILYSVLWRIFSEAERMPTSYSLYHIR